SRGAAAVTFVEASRPAVGGLRKNLDTCQLVERARGWVGRTSTFLARRGWWEGAYTGGFADPPYAARSGIEGLAGRAQPGLLSLDSVIVIEQASQAELPAKMGSATLTRRCEYGDTALGFYHNAPRQ